MEDPASQREERSTGPDGPVDQQGAAVQANPAPAGSGSPGGPAEEAGIVDQQDAARAAMDRAEPDPELGE